MTKKVSAISAAELTAKLHADPEFLARQEERNRERIELAARLRLEEEPLLAELRGVGWRIESVWELVNSATGYKEAVPILLKHLPLPYADRIREGIARALAVPDARYAWPELVAEYRKAPVGSEKGIRLGAKSGLAAALAATVTDHVMNELLDLAKDRSHGDSRLLLLKGLKKFRSAISKEAWEDLESDPALTKELAAWRRK